MPRPAQGRPVQGLNAAAGITLDSSPGQIFLIVTDCFWGPASGVEVTTDVHDERVERVYGLSGNLSQSATDTTGQVFFSNAPPGNVHLTPDVGARDRGWCAPCS